MPSILGKSLQLELEGDCDLSNSDANFLNRLN